MARPIHGCSTQIDFSSHIFVYCHTIFVALIFCMHLLLDCTLCANEYWIYIYCSLGVRHVLGNQLLTLHVSINNFTKICIFMWQNKFILLYFVCFVFLLNIDGFITVQYALTNVATKRLATFLTQFDRFLNNQWNISWGFTHHHKWHKRCVVIWCNIKMTINFRESNGVLIRYQWKGKEAMQSKDDTGVDIMWDIGKQSKLPSIDVGVGVRFITSYHVSWNSWTLVKPMWDSVK